MYRVTDRRLNKARNILEQHRTSLHKTGSMDTIGFEMELRECWAVGYQEMKDLAEDLLKNGRYRYVAAYYMEHSNGSPDMAVSEFWEPLAKLYGVPYYRAEGQEDGRKQFWATMPQE